LSKCMLVAKNRAIAAHELCCLLQQCEALRTCRSGFPIATQEAMHAEIA